VDTLAIQSPYSADRHDAGCGGAGGDCVRGKIVVRQFVLRLRPGFFFRLIRYTSVAARSLYRGLLVQPSITGRDEFTLRTTFRPCACNGGHLVRAHPVGLQEAAPAAPLSI
jgi:hypothetical protein